jgi:lytic murein transglycosylase
MATSHRARTVAAASCVALALFRPPDAAAQAASASPVSPPASAQAIDASASTPLASASAPAEVDAALKARFASWVAAFRVDARAAGIAEATLRAAFDDVQYLPRVVELDRAQPEFVRPVWDYLDTAVSATRVARGLEKLQQVREVADRASSRHGVPATVLVAIWGIESSYGEHTGNTPTIDALATLGFDGRREAWAKGQLLAALKILQSGDIERSRMIGSWAGAMGQTQFLPSNYLAYAVDADGDGRRDLWGSAADVLASTANFLARVGWRSGEPWGGEVRLPAGFDVGRADAQTRQSSAQWAAEGVRPLAGGRLPELDDAGILLPAGARGPAFLVGPNFRTILRYNNATSYALAVHLLAQRLAGGPAVQAGWPRDLQLLSRTQIVSLQAALQERGFDLGAADGILGPATREALRRYQKHVGLPADGFPTLELLQRLQNP